ncbi:MAG: hypothetical protein JOZ50_09455 [Candidatus Eremiobacteraeota bacterium]|nr:hypothetical protein [Candidatus Eremiobacteraeota bacterium]
MTKERYPFTPDAAKNALLARSGTALLIGMCLDQQVRTEKAMSGPYELQERIGHLEARKIANMPLARLQAVFRQPPALHRFPGMMAKRVRALCAIVAREYGGDGARVWTRAKDATEVYERLRALPGFGDGKAKAGVHILALYGKHKLAGWRRYAVPDALPWEFRDGKKIDR